MMSKDEKFTPLQYANSQGAQKPCVTSISSEEDDGEAGDVDESNADADERQSVIATKTEKCDEFTKKGFPTMKIFGSDYQLLGDKNKNQSCNISYNSDASDNEITGKKKVKNIEMSPKKLYQGKGTRPPSDTSKVSKKSKVIVISLNDLKKE